MKSCVNCGSETDTPHCPNCGQKIEVKRVTLRGILNEFVSKWIGLDNQFGRTIIDMVRKPGVVINSYLQGNRTKYLGPLGFLLVMTALMVISLDLFGLEAGDFIKKNNEAFQPYLQGEQELNADQIAAQKKVSEFIGKNFRFFSMILIPFWAIALWFLYKKSKFNYIERLVVTVYATSQGIWLTIITFALLALTGRLYNEVLIILLVFYYSYVFYKTFHDKNYVISFLKTILAYALTIFLMIVFGFMVTLAVIIIAVLLNPEIIQKQG